MSMPYGNDHALALKIADEVIRINNNIINTKAPIKDIDQLKASIKKILDNFKLNGYEIIDMLNKPYSDAMQVKSTFKSDDNSNENSFMITKIIKPQVNFQGKMIQAAHVEVGFYDAIKEFKDISEISR
jgi:hypothetical protein